ncbi:uncharacterized protein F5Z01DRAFT_354339 [Emericellopsis atlantica]|uniref:Uncharacterized protein n=1 Tax=Emericellopsis atlantica TaxID=2614577 RepID=A0A9P7ZEU5_9HYPO|nr:uncharacterized protein F5Z01DRAFT_354339 [Emericellopsis atlantica]KAG9250646.1 hypothetical protein F5Z01DRAFT_354339 [Emericellopsis atlantica]
MERVSEKEATGTYRSPWFYMFLLVQVYAGVVARYSVLAGEQTEVLSCSLGVVGRIRREVCDDCVAEEKTRKVVVIAVSKEAREGCYCRRSWTMHDTEKGRPKWVSSLPLVPPLCLIPPSFLFAVGLTTPLVHHACARSLTTLTSPVALAPTTS